jgi:isopentenyldiphosphate isomerase
MEYLDIYDENKKFLGTKSREEVHKEGFWHNTVHCWLFDKHGNIYFQIRADEGKFYTTASGHVNAGETIKEAFGREIKEEIGIEVEFNNAILVDIVVWKMDKEKNGVMFKDRAFSNVYICEYDEHVNNFNFDIEEVTGLVKVDAKKILELFEKESGDIDAEMILLEDNKIINKKNKVAFDCFLVNKHETAISKYGDVLRKVIDTCYNKCL